MSRVLPDNKYDIDYDDGDKDSALSAEFIRPAQKVSHFQERCRSFVRKASAGAMKQESSMSKNDETEIDKPEEIHDKTFSLGQKIEARYHNRGKRWYRGTIVNVLPDEKYDVNYDDGDKDRLLPSSAIRAFSDKEGINSTTRDCFNNHGEGGR